MTYSGTLTSKNSCLIPVFLDGKPMHSKYNPQGEAALFKDRTGCLVVAGLGGGFHLTEAVKTCSLVIACEKDEESLNFCLKLPSVRELCSKKNMLFATEKTLGSVLLSNYLPHMHGGIEFVFHRAWEDREKQSALTLKEIFSTAVRHISADYSVQSHFAKLWQRNIFINLRTFTKNPDIRNVFDTKKSVAVIAAGPSLDEDITYLRQNRNQYEIFATDTALSSLVAQGIIPDAVVSIDAQHLSTEHFKCLGSILQNEKKPVCFFDAASANESISMARKNACTTFLVHNGHPLLALASQKANIPQIQTGSGTVTIASCDIAQKLGFKDIKLFGADFAYSGGRPYARGTYLDKLYKNSSLRTDTLEEKFCALMFRTELYDTVREGLKNAKTSTVLEGYKASLELWQKEKNQPTGPFYRDLNFNFKDFCKEWKEGVEESIKENCTSLTPALCTLLPLTAFLKRISKDKLDFFSLVKLAYSYSLRYTE